jgi:hypothetical protein
VDRVHEFMDRAGVAGPWFHRGLHGGRWPGLGLAVAPGHDGLPRGWRREGRDTAQPGDRSLEYRYPFIGSGGGRGGREWRAAVVIGAFMAAVTGVKGGASYGRLKGGQPLQLHGAEGGAASMARRRRERRRRRCRLSEGGRKGKGGTTWGADSACLAARGQKG